MLFTIFDRITSAGSITTVITGPKDRLEVYKDHMSPIKRDGHRIRWITTEPGLATATLTALVEYVQDPEAVHLQHFTETDVVRVSGKGALGGLMLEIIPPLTEAEARILAQPALAMA